MTTAPEAIGTAGAGVKPAPGRAAAMAQPHCKVMCKRCAFREGSPERLDPYVWMQLNEAWDEDGLAFYCHESVPGHRQEKQDEAPRWRVCAGWLARDAKIVRSVPAQAEDAR